MKSIIQAVLVYALVISPTTVSCQKHEVVWRNLINAKPKHSIYIAGFNNPKHGITGGAAGKTYYTIDSGATWHQAQNASLCRFGLDILDDQNAFHCGNGGEYKTIDGGKTWTKIKSINFIESNEFKYVRFVNKSIGWMGSTNLLISTADGGTTWDRVETPQGLAKIASIDLPTDSNGKTCVVLGSNGILYTTCDGGISWEQRAIKVGGHEFSFIPLLCGANAMHFESLSEGCIIAYQVEPKKGWISLITKDTGNTWAIDDVTNEMSEKSSVYMSNDGRYITFYYPFNIRVYERVSGTGS